MYVCRLLLAPGGGEEVAIDASALAEGDVDIDSCHGYSIKLFLIVSF
jgi:hypothetical protein